MERIAIAIQDGGAGAGAIMAARAARPTSFLSCHRTSMWAPPVGGTFQFQIFIQASSSEIWRKTIFGGEGGCWRGKLGGLFWATSFEKNLSAAARPRERPEPPWPHLAIHAAEHEFPPPPRITARSACHRGSG